MQQTKMNRRETIIMGIKGFFWVTGLLMAGSDSNFMPWGNGIGLLLFSVSSLSLGKQSFNIASKTRTAGRPGFYRKACEKRRFSLFVPATNL